MGMAKPEFKSKTAVRNGNGRTTDFVVAERLTMYTIDGYPGSYFMKVSNSFGMANPICVLAREYNATEASFFIEVASRSSAHQIIQDDGTAINCESLGIR